MSKATIEPMILLSRPTINLQVDVNFNEFLNNAFDGQHSSLDFIRMPWLADDAIQQTNITQCYGDF